MQCAAQLATPATYGTAIGMAMAVSAITNLIGNPISGELIPHGYLAMSMFAGASLLAGGLLLVLARFTKEKRLFAKV